MARGLKWLAISFSGGPCFVRTLHCDPSFLVALHGMACGFIELGKPLHHNKAVIHEGELNYVKHLLVQFCVVVS